MPKLSKAGYSTQPSLAQLAALAREDPGLLASVANFVVSLKDVGQVRWLQPVDLRGLDLDDIVHLSPGTVEVGPICMVLSTLIDSTLRYFWMDKCVCVCVCVSIIVLKDLGLCSCSCQISTTLCTFPLAL